MEVAFAETLGSAMTAAGRFGAAHDRWVNAGVVADEYRVRHARG